MIKKILPLGLQLIFFATLFYPVAHFTDWGSDFAHYVHQAKNIVEGIAQQDNGFIINDNCAQVSPQAYSIGFPLIASIVYFFNEFDVASFVYLQTIFLSLIGVIIFRIIRTTNGIWYALLGASLFVFAPYTIWFRNHILSEYSYIFFQMLFLLIYWKNKKGKNWIILGLILGFAWSIRSTALSLVLAIGLMELVKMLTHRSSLVLKDYFGKSLYLHGLIVGVAYGFFKLLNTVIFDVGDNVSFHSQIYRDNFQSSTIIENFKYYLLQIYEPYFEFWQISWIGTISAVVLVILFIKGFGKLESKYRLIYYILFVQVAMILFFPFQQGMRYVLPIMPFVFILIVKGLQHEMRQKSLLKYLYPMTLALFMYSNFKGISQVNDYVKFKPTWSPSTDETMKGWEYINKNIDENSVFIAAFPRVLTLYSEVSAFSPCVSDNETIWKDINRFKATHIITNTQTNQWVPTLNDFIVSNTASLDTLYSNSEVAILKIKK